MPRKPKHIKTKGVSLYNKILKQFTKTNKKLPLELQLSLADRRKYISEKIYPQYKGTDKTKVGIRAINKSIEQVLETIVPTIGSNVNYISPSVTADVAWHELDDFIREVLPKNIFIKVDAGTYGQTKILNTNDYNYTASGVRGIVDNIRDFVNNDSAVDVSFTGNKKLKKGRSNNGNPKNYYIDFILVVNSEPIDLLSLPIIYKLPKTESKAVSSVKSAILARVKELSNKKKRKKNARKTAIKNITKVKKINIRQKRSTKQETKNKLRLEKDKLYKSMQKQLDSSFNKGHLTQEQYDRYSQDLAQRIFDNMKDGGLI